MKNILDIDDLYRATIMVLSDRPHETVDAAFYHARSRGDELHEFVATLFLKEHVMEKVVINGSDGRHKEMNDPGAVWLGANAWASSLRMRGVSSRIILHTPPAYDTREESLAFITLAQKKGWKSAVIVSQPHQVLRAMLNAVAAMQELGYTMRIYAVAPSSVAWEKLVYGSQGEECLPLSEHILPERNRIISSHREYKLLPILPRLFQYWKDREKIQS
ncbi:MAG: hypothetical protein IPJ68_04040 [Candidatus Moraniibacteriota bacterium]|nr:MAG: hypothetical protein IPJ68_04040 [Candidatus Moranbacteria bacterium]